MPRRIGGILIVLLLAMPGPPVHSVESGTLETLRRLVHDGAYAQAQSQAREYLRQQQSAGRGESPETAEATLLLVETLWRGGKEKDPETRRLAEQCVELCRRVFGEEDENYAWSLANLAVVLRRIDDLEGAQSLLKRALAIREKLFGPRSMKVALTLNTLSAPEGMSGNFIAAREHLERALSICDEQGVRDEGTAGILYNLGSLGEASGDYAAARDYHARALAIRLKELSPDHPQTAESMFAVAVMLTRLGDLPEARVLYERALAVQERVLGPDHPDFAESLSNLAHVMAKTGHFAEAKTLQERALGILERALGSDHSRASQVRADLAADLAGMEDFAGAKRLMEIVTSDQERVVGPAHPDLAGSLNVLADAELHLGESAAAERHFRRALSIFDKAYGPGHPDSAASLEGLGRVQSLAGHNVPAENFYRQALAVRRAKLGASHPAVAEGLTRLAGVDRALGHARRAFEESLQAEEILGAYFGRSLRGLSEREGLEYERVRASGLNTALSVLAASPARDLPEDAVERAWIAVVRSRALVLDQMARLHRAGSGNDDPVEAGLFRDLVAATNRLANLVVRGPDPAHPDRYPPALGSATRDKETLERQLAARSRLFRVQVEQARVNFAGLRNSLPRATSLVAFTLYDRGGRGASVSTAKTPAYMAFVLSPDLRQPVSVPIGEAGEIDRLVGDWRRISATPPDLLGAAPGTRARALRDIGNRLRAKIWDPVIKAVAASGQVLVVPDGTINLVSFATLPAGEDGYLVERGPTFHYLSAERDLLLLAEAEPKPGHGVMLLGGADFDASANAAPNLPSSTAPDVGAPASGHYRGPAASCDSFRTVRFDPLPESTREVEEIRDIIGQEGAASDRGSSEIIELAEKGANEEAFKSLAPGHRILHLATHAFFFDGGCVTSSPGTAPDNPLLLSGLAVAGANRRNDAGPGAEDGIVTSEEIATLDLTGVEWAVLSACESGLGRIQTGEGVLGLRRAFQVAGVRTLIGSLWKVDDESTRDWMRRLYQARLKGKSTAESVREASAATLRERRAAGRSTDPFFWGAFAAAGDWR